MFIFYRYWIKYLFLKHDKPKTIFWFLNDNDIKTNSCYNISHIPTFLVQVSKIVHRNDKGKCWKLDSNAYM